MCDVGFRYRYCGRKCLEKRRVCEKYKFFRVYFRLNPTYRFIFKFTLVKPNFTRSLPRKLQIKIEMFGC